MLFTRTRLAFLGLVAIVAVAAGCGGGGAASSIPTRTGAGPMSALPPPMAVGKKPSISPGSVHPGPMVQTQKLDPKSFTSGKRAAVAVNDPNWSVVLGGASAVTVSPADPINCPGTTTGHGSIFVLSPDPAGPDKYIWEGDGQGNWCNLPGLAKQIAVAPNGTVYAVNSAGEIYSFDGTSWTGIAGRASGVTAAADGSLYVLSNENGSGDEPIWHYSGGTWTYVPGSGVQIASSWDAKSYSGAGGTIPADALYVLTSQGYIYAATADGSTYVGMPGSASFIAPVVVNDGSGTAGGGIYALASPLDTTNGSSMYYYDLDNAAWSGVPGAAVSVAALSLNGGANASVWAIASSGAILTSSITATPSPTAAPTVAPTPANVIVNGDFATGDLTGWYQCFSNHQSFGSSPVNPSTTQVGIDAQAAGITGFGTPRPGPSASPYPGVNSLGTQLSQTTVQTVTPTTMNGFTDAALVGHSDYPFNTSGVVGICQDVVVPAGSPTLKFSLYEGGNDDFTDMDQEGDVFVWADSSTSPFTTTSGVTSSTAAFTTLFSEDNCYNNLYSSTVAVGTTSTRAMKSCGTNNSTATGGQWYQRTFDFSAYAGKNVTVLLGIWRKASSGSPSASTYYTYAYYSGVSLQ